MTEDHHIACQDNILSAQGLALPEARHHAMLGILKAYYQATGAVPKDDSLLFPQYKKAVIARSEGPTITLTATGLEHWEGNTYRGRVTAEEARCILKLEALK